MSNYNWQYCKIGGMTRIDIKNGNDIAHLDQLDHKLWTVLACPASGLEFNPDTLKILDADNDGMIHIDEVVAASKWLTGALKNPDEIIEGNGSIAVDAFNPETEEGALLKKAAEKALSLTGSDKTSVSPSDIAAALDKIKEMDSDSADKIEKVLPYGDDSEAAEAVVSKLAAKIDDWFLRSRLASYSAESFEKLNVSSDKIAEIGTGMLPGCMEEIASYPLTKLTQDGRLPLEEAINPAWDADFQTLKSKVISLDFPSAKSISQGDWDSIKAKVATFTAYKASVKEMAENFNKTKDSDKATITRLGDFIALNRDFYKFLRNFITFNDFYSRDPEKLSIFQAGRLYIDQRCCDLCLKVSDMGAHADMSGLSGMFLLYCDCTSKKLGRKMTIVAAVTRGDINDLRVGKNAVFYDRAGNDWDAVVTKVIDNPLSIKQAFWSPYKKFWHWCTDKITKSAQEKESKSIESLTAKADTATTKVEDADPNKASKAKQAFDIAKFAGIFAAIGMAIGYISTALVALVNGVTAKWYNLPLLIAAVIILISGPSMFLAWIKLRKRNLSPILNANGWAINAAALIRTDFGRTLTSEANFGVIKKKGKGFLIFLAVILVLAGIVAALYFTGHTQCCFPFFK